MKKVYVSFRSVTVALAAVVLLATGVWFAEGAEIDQAEVVLTVSGCDYFVAVGPRGYYLLEWYGGHTPDKGDRIVGEISSYGFKDVLYPGNGSGRVWVDDYMLGRNRAVERLVDKCD